jgi:calcineurin-like phosphoesterase family protein
MRREDYLAKDYTEQDKKLIKIFNEEVKKLDMLYFRAINSNDSNKAKQISQKITEIVKLLQYNYDEWADEMIPKEYLKGATYIDDSFSNSDTL